MRWPLAALAAGPLLLGGCDLAPHYKVPTVVVPASYHDTEVWQPGQPADTLPRSDWWVEFQDPVLDKLERQLSTQNFTLAAAEASFTQARANAAEAIAGLFPSIGVEGGLAKTDYPHDKTLTTHGLPPFLPRNTLAGNLTYEFDFWDRIHNEVAAGTAAAQASAADLAFVRLSLEAELADDYLELRGLDALEDLLARTVTAYQRAYDVVRNRFQGLIASGVDVPRAETQLYSAQAELQDLRARRALIEHAIAALIGVPAPAFALAPSFAPIKPPELAASVPSVLLQRRPDIAAAERQVASANATIGVARAAFFPNVQFNAIGGYQSANINLVSAPNSFWSLGPSLSLPIFEGGFLRAQEATTIAGFNLATANYRNTVVTAFKEVADALSQLHWYDEELHADRQAVDAAQHTLNLAMTLFVDGAVNYLEVVVAQEQLLGAQQLLLTLQTQYLQSGVRLIRALGGGWSERDLPQPDAMPLRHVSITQ